MQFFFPPWVGVSRLRNKERAFFFPQGVQTLEVTTPPLFLFYLAMFFLVCCIPALFVLTPHVLVQDKKREDKGEKGIHQNLHPAGF